MTKDFYVYVHKRASDGTVFYVGKGHGKRARSSTGRSAYWKRIVAKHGCIVEIVASGLLEWYANELERDLICSIGRENLCNLTDGGEGTAGLKRKPLPEVSRLKISAALKGRKSPRSKEHQAKLSATLRGRKTGPLPEAQRAKIGSAHVGKTRSKEQRAAMSEAQRRRVRKPLSESHKAAIGAASRRQPGRPVACSNGMVFEKLIHAEAWLREHVNPKADYVGIVSAINRKGSAYGFTWQFPEQK